jgi:hypothetical protein
MKRHLAITSALIISLSINPLSANSRCNPMITDPAPSREANNPNVVPEFDQLGPYCQYDTPDPLPTVSTNGITGHWDPSVIDTSVSGTFTYSFTPDPGQGGTTTTMVIEIIPRVYPEFDPLGPFCQFTTPPSLPAVSANGVTGTWSPATIQTDSAGTRTYTFTPDQGFCSNILSMDITVLALPTAEISYPKSVCCVTDEPQEVIISGAMGGTFSATPAGLVIDSIRGTIYPSQSAPGQYTVHYVLEALGNCARVESSAEVTIIEASSSHPTSLGNGISIFPNPNHGAFHFEIQSAGSETVRVSVMDLTGRTVYDGTYTNAPVISGEINIQKEGAGIFVMRVVAHSKVVEQKLIVD